MASDLRLHELPYELLAAWWYHDRGFAHAFTWLVGNSTAADYLRTLFQGENSYPGIPTKSRADTPVDFHFNFSLILSDFNRNLNTSTCTIKAHENFFSCFRVDTSGQSSMATLVGSFLQVTDTEAGHQIKSRPLSFVAVLAQRSLIILSLDTDSTYVVWVTGSVPASATNKYNYITPDTNVWTVVLVHWPKHSHVLCFTYCTVQTRDLKFTVTLITRHVSAFLKKL